MLLEGGPRLDGMRVCGGGRQRRAANVARARFPKSRLADEILRTPQPAGMRWKKGAKGLPLPLPWEEAANGMLAHVAARGTLVHTGEGQGLQTRLCCALLHGAKVWGLHGMAAAALVAACKLGACAGQGMISAGPTAGIGII